MSACSGCNGTGAELSGTTYGGLSEEVGCGQCGDDCPADCGCRMSEPDEHPWGSRDCCRVVAPAQVAESGASAAPGATQSSPGSPSAGSVLSEAERAALDSARVALAAIVDAVDRLADGFTDAAVERHSARAGVERLLAERDAARTTAALLEADGARLRERIAAYAATVEDDCQGDLACDVHHVDFVTVGDWRGCAWVADLRALLTEGGETRG